MVNLDLRSEKLFMSPFELNIDQTPQHENLMVTIDWIESGTLLIPLVHGRLQHTALKVSSWPG